MLRQPGDVTKRVMHPYALTPSKAQKPVSELPDKSSMVVQPQYSELCGTWSGPFIMGPYNGQIVRRSADLLGYGAPCPPPRLCNKSLLKSRPAAVTSPGYERSSCRCRRVAQVLGARRRWKPHQGGPRVVWHRPRRAHRLHRRQDQPLPQAPHARGLWAVAQGHGVGLLHDHALGQERAGRKRRGEEGLRGGEGAFSAAVCSVRERASSVGLQACMRWP